MATDPKMGLVESRVQETELLSTILAWTRLQQGHVAVQAGHFVLLPQGQECVPCVASETDNAGDQPERRNVILQYLAGFSLATWRIGVRLLAALCSGSA